jgi:phage-related protein
MARALIVQILGDARQFGAELDKAAGKTRQMGRVAGVAGLAIAGGLAIGLEKSVKAAADASTQTARLDAAFKASGESAGSYGGQISTAEEHARSLGFTNEDVRASLGSLEIATKNGTKAIADLGVAQNLARFKGISLADASKTLTMAMAGSQRAVKQLGITVPAVTLHYDALKRTGEDLTTVTGRLDEAHAKLQDKMATSKAVIAAVTEKTKGQAQAFADTAQGGLAQMHAQLGALEENLGSALLPALVAVSGELAKFTGFLAEHQTTAKIAVVAIGLLAAALIAASIATSIMTAATIALDIAASPLLIPILAIIAALVLLGAAAYEIVKHWGAISGFFTDMWTKVKGAFTAGIDFVKEHWRAFATVLATILLGPLGGLVVLIATHWTQIKKKFTDGISDVVGFMTALPDKLVHAVGDLSKLLGKKGTDLITGLLSTIKTKYGDVTSFISGIPGAITKALGDLSKLLYKAGASIIQGLIDGIKSKLKTVENIASSIGHKIASLKGPLEVDRVLLVPAGQAIIGGLQAGMESALPGVYGLAASIGPKISTGAAAPLPIGGGAAGASGGGHTINVGPVYGTVDAAFARTLANQLATQLRGGRVPQLQQAIKAN